MGFMQAPTSPRNSVQMKMNETNKEEKRRSYRYIIDGRKPFIRCTQRTGENNLNEL